MPIMEVVVEGRYFNQQTIARWNYLSSGTPAAVSFSFAGASALGLVLGAGDTDFPVDSMARAWQDLVTGEFQFVQMQVRDVYNPVDFYASPFPSGVDGNRSEAGGVSPATAFGFRSSRTRLDIRRGFKRFAGVVDSAIGNGGVIESADVARMNTLATAMSATAEYDDEGQTISFAPIIVSKEKYMPPDSTKYAYRYYATEAEQMNRIMTGIIWSGYAQTRTQTSRQYQRGS